MPDPKPDLSNLLEIFKKELIQGQPDDLSHVKQEEDEVVRDAQEAKTKRDALLNQQLKQEIKERLKYSGRLFWLLVVWLIAVVAIIVLHGFSAWGFDLSSNVLMMLIGSTTFNVIGMFLIVAKYLFSPNRK